MDEEAVSMYKEQVLHIMVYQGQIDTNFKEGLGEFTTVFQAELRTMKKAIIWVSDHLEGGTDTKILLNLWSILDAIVLVKSKNQTSRAVNEHIYN